MSDDDFSNHPVSIAELKAARNKDGALWKPRDALISALREIDSGEIDPSDLILLWRAKDRPDEIRLYNSTSDTMIASGMVAKAMRYFSV